MVDLIIGVEDKEGGSGVVFVMGDFVGSCSVFVCLEDFNTFFAVGVEVDLGLVSNWEAGAVLVDSAEGGEEVGDSEVAGVINDGFFVGGEELSVGDVDLDVCFIGFGVVGEVEVLCGIAGDLLGDLVIGGFDLKSAVSGIGGDAFEVNAVFHGFGP
jgi:hypothetical protein